MIGKRLEHKVCKQIINAEETLHGGYHTQHLIKETLSPPLRKLRISLENEMSEKNLRKSCRRQD